MIGFKIKCKTCGSTFEIRDPKIRNMTYSQCPCCGLQFPPETLRNLIVISGCYEVVSSTAKNFDVSIFEFLSEDK